MSIESPEQHLEPMTAGERAVLLFTAIVPPLAVAAGVLGLFGWSMLSGRHARLRLGNAAGELQVVLFVLFVLGMVLRYWLVPALSDLFGGKVLVAEGELHVEQHFTTSNSGRTHSHYRCWISSPADAEACSPRCEISLWTFLRLRGKKGRTYRLYIAPHSKKLVHFRRAA